MKNWIDNIKKSNIIVESWAGSSTKVAGYIGMLESLYQKSNYRPDLINGVSGGAIITILRIKLMLDPTSINQIIKLGTEFDLETIFEKPPFTTDSIRFKSILNLIKGSPGMASHSKLLDSLFSIFTEEDFNNYKRDPNLPVGLICSVNMENAALRIANIKLEDYTYSELKQDLLASTSIPLVMEPILINDEYYHDGGVRYSNAGSYIIDKLFLNSIVVSKHISLYSRPRDLKDVIKEPIQRTKPGWFKLSGRLVLRVFKIRMYQNSKFCELAEIRQARSKKIILKQFFLPQILKSLFDTDKDSLRKLYEEGKKSIGNL